MLILFPLHKARFLLKAALPLFASALAFLLVSLEGAASAPLDAAARIVPHRAVYQLTLDRSRGQGSGDVSGASGRLEFEWGDACTGWSIKQRTRVLVLGSSGGEMDFGWTWTAWEAKNGLSYKYFIRRYGDGQPTEELRGRAVLNAIGGAGLATLESPEERKVELPVGTVFPTWHSLEILDHAQEGELPIWRPVFDGSEEGAGLSWVSAVLVKRLPPEQPDSKSPLLQAESFRLLLAYFDLDPQQMVPLHEQELRLYVNGVADDFVFDYGDFALRARLVEIEALPEMDC